MVLKIYVWSAWARTFFVSLGYPHYVCFWEIINARLMIEMVERTSMDKWLPTLTLDYIKFESSAEMNARVDWENGKGLRDSNHNWTKLGRKSTTDNHEQMFADWNNNKRLTILKQWQMLLFYDWSNEGKHSMALLKCLFGQFGSSLSVCFLSFYCSLFVSNGVPACSLI